MTPPRQFDSLSGSVKDYQTGQQTTELTMYNTGNAWMDLMRCCRLNKNLLFVCLFVLLVSC